MPPDMFVAMPELMRAIYETLSALRRDLEQSNQLQKQTVSALRDVASELEFLRTERRRMDRIEAKLAELVELDRNNARIEKLLDEAGQTLGKVSTVIGGDGT